MLSIVGILVVFICVFGGYILAGGSMGVILKALPLEAFIICGAAIGAYLICNTSSTAKALLKDFSRVFKGAKFHKHDYIQLLKLLLTITKTIKAKGMLEIESHIENPAESIIFKEYPTILKDHLAISMISDTLRLMSMGFENPYQLDDMLSSQLEKITHEKLESSHSLQQVSEGLPAIGIVAAVLGVIKTMSHVTEPPPVLGKMIGGALVGTFLGVFLAYCFVAPMATKIANSMNEDLHYYKLIKDVLVGHLQGLAPQIGVEVARGNIPEHCQPNFQELDQALNEAPAG